MNRRQLTLSTVAAIGLLVPCASALAQSVFPDRSIKLVVPFPPGGTSDLTGRILADALSEEIGQPIVVDNKGGAGGTIGARFVADAKPDGYTLLLDTSSTNGTSSVVYRNLAYDAVKSFTPITRIVTVPGVLGVTAFPTRHRAAAAPRISRWNTTNP